MIDGTADGVIDGTSRSEVLEDLRRIIRRIERSRPPRPAPEPVERLLGGELVDTGAGSIVVVRREYPLSHRHGRQDLGTAFSIAGEHLRLVAGLDEDPPLAPHGLVFLDTETTGLAGGTGTYVFLVGVGLLEGDRLTVIQYFMRDFDDEPALLALLGPLLERAAGIVTFNGAGFDLPLLETRFVLARRRWPIERLHVDLLRPARRVWGLCLADCRLGTLEREVLGLVREGDVASALIPSLYLDYLRFRRAAPLPAILAHNRDDVLSLVALLGWFARALDGAAPQVAPAELAGIGRLWERADPGRSVCCYREALDGGLAGVLGQRIRLRLAWHDKRAARWESACALWEAAARAEVFDPRPWEELAKFHEHRRRDVGAARRVVTEALDLARHARVADRILDAFARRLNRLDRRLAAAR